MLQALTTPAFTESDAGGLSPLAFTVMAVGGADYIPFNHRTEANFNAVRIVANTLLANHNPTLVSIAIKGETGIDVTADQATRMVKGEEAFPDHFNLSTVDLSLYLSDAEEGKPEQTRLVPLVKAVVEEYQKKELEPATIVNEKGGIELEETAKIIATNVRKEGLGYLYGAFPRNGPVKKLLSGNFGDLAIASAFFKGQVVNEKDAKEFITFIGIPARTESSDRLDEQPNQRLIIELFLNPTRDIIYGDNNKSSRTRSKQYVDYKGFCIGCWNKVTFLIPVTTSTDEKVEYMSMVLIVPPKLTEQIIVQTQTDSSFMDALFKAMYPGIIGTDPAKYICQVDTSGRPVQIENKTSTIR